MSGERSARDRLPPIRSHGSKGVNDTLPKSKHEVFPCQCGIQTCSRDLNDGGGSISLPTKDQAVLMVCLDRLGCPAGPDRTQRVDLLCMEGGKEIQISALHSYPVDLIRRGQQVTTKDPCAFFVDESEWFPRFRSEIESNSDFDRPRIDILPGVACAYAPQPSISDEPLQDRRSSVSADSCRMELEEHEELSPSALEVELQKKLAITRQAIAEIRDEIEKEKQTNNSLNALSFERIATGDLEEDVKAYTGFPNGASLEAFYNLCRVAGCEKLILYRGLNNMPTSPEPPAGADGATADTDSALPDTAASACTTP